MNYPTVETQYFTKDGDAIDALVWNYYGTVEGTVEATYARNSDVLSRYPALLPMGVLIVFPIISQQPTGFTLWDYPPETVYQFTPPPTQDTLATVDDALDLYRAIRDA